MHPGYGYAAAAALPPATHFSIDIECVATGPKHNDRDVAQIAVVDQYERVLLNVYVRPAKPVVSYLTPLTGLTEPLLRAHGVPLPAALDAVRRCLPRTAVLVGQNIAMDVQWLGLKEGVDFAGLMDLAGLYRVWNERYKSWSVFGQDHLAETLLRWDTSGGHDAVGDAVKSVRLFNFHQRTAGDAEAWARVQAQLLGRPPKPSFAKENPTFEGVCMGNKRTCTCGAPFFF